MTSPCSSSSCPGSSTATATKISSHFQSQIVNFIRSNIMKATMQTHSKLCDQMALCCLSIQRELQAFRLHLHHDGSVGSSDDGSSSSSDENTSAASDSRGSQNASKALFWKQILQYIKHLNQYFNTKQLMRLKNVDSQAYYASLECIDFVREILNAMFSIMDYHNWVKEERFVATMIVDGPDRFSQLISKLKKQHLISKDDLKWFEKRWSSRSKCSHSYSSFSAATGRTLSFKKGKQRCEKKNRSAFSGGSNLQRSSSRSSRNNVPANSHHNSSSMPLSEISAHVSNQTNKSHPKNSSSVHPAGEPQRKYRKGNSINHQSHHNQKYYNSSKRSKSARRGNRRNNNYSQKQNFAQFSDAQQYTYYAPNAYMAYNGQYPSCSSYPQYNEQAPNFSYYPSTSFHYHAATSSFPMLGKHSSGNDCMHGSNLYHQSALNGHQYSKPTPQLYYNDHTSDYPSDEESLDDTSEDDVEFILSPLTGDVSSFK